MASDGTSFSPPLVSPASASKTAKVAANDVLMIVWARQQRRASNMCEALGFQLRFVNGIQLKSNVRIFSLAAKAFEYFCKFFETIGVIILRRPKICVVQNPPFFVIFAAYFGMILAFRWPRLIGDCHNLLPPWDKMPGSKLSLRLCELYVAHNDDIFRQLPVLGYPTRNARVLETRPTVVNIEVTKKFEDPKLDAIFAKGRPTLIVPLAWLADEPLEEIVGLGRELPDFEILMTGEKGLRSPLKATAPENVHFTGFMSKADYLLGMMKATVVVGLTTVEGIQMSVANEGVGMGRPMVLSGTQTTRRMFHKGATYVTEHTSQGIAAAVSEAMPQLEHLSSQSRELRAERLRHWETLAIRVVDEAGIQTSLKKRTVENV